MKTLILSFKFTASHSLEVREVPHDHLWILTVGVSGHVQNGFIINLLTFREDVRKLLEHLENTFLNDSDYLSNEAKKYPTCETLSDFFWDKIQQILEDYQKTNPSILLAFVEVALHEDGEEMGRIRREK